MDTFNQGIKGLIPSRRDKIILVVGLFFFVFNSTFGFESSLQDSIGLPIAQNEQIEIDESEAQKLKEKAIYHLGVSEYDEAIENLRSAKQISNNPQLEAEIINTLASCYFLKFDFDQTIATLENYQYDNIGLFENYQLKTAQVFTQSGAYYYTGRLEKLDSFIVASFSEESSKEAHKFNDLISEYRNTNLLWNNGDIYPGVNYFKKHIQEDKLLHLSENTYYRFLGDLYNVKGNYDKALFFYNLIPTNEEDLITKGFTYYSRLIELYIKSGDFEKAEEYLEKMNLMNRRGINPFKDIFQDYLNVLFLYVEDSEEAVKTSTELLKTSEEKDLIFFQTYFSICFAELCFANEDTEQAKVFLNGINPIGEDKVSLQRAYILSKKINAESNQFTPQSLEVDVISDEDLDNLINEIYPLVQKASVPFWVMGLLGLLGLFLISLAIKYVLTQIKNKSEKEALRSEYTSLIAKFEDLKMSTEASELNTSANNVLQKSQRENKIKQLENLYSSKEGQIQNLQKKLSSLESKYDELQNKSTDSRSKFQIEKEEISENYKMLQSELEYLKVLRKKESSDLEKFEERLFEKEIQLENAQRNLEKQRSDKIIKLANYKEQLSGLESELKHLERRTSGTLNKEINGLISQLSFKTQYENYLSNFMDEVEIRYPNFAQELSNLYTLTEKQKIIAYTIKMDMSVADIAQLMGTGKEAVKKAKNRLWKQMSFQSLEELRLKFKSL